MRTFLKKREFLIMFFFLIIGSGFFVGKIFAEAPPIVINEIMWMGSSVSSSDEWIELRNTTNKSIDLSNWQLTKYSKIQDIYKENLMITIPQGKNISANGYFLIANNDNAESILNIKPDMVDTAISLANSKLQIKLYCGDWQNKENLIDVADDGVGEPLAGKYGKSEAIYSSMERKDVFGNGEETESWQTCLYAANIDYGLSELATPGTKNSQEPKPIIYSSKIRINELVPNPEGDDSGNEYVELYNFDNEDIKLDEGWMLADADRNNKDKIGKTKKIGGTIKKDGGFLEIKKTVSLNNDWDAIYLLNPNGDEVDKVSYEKAEENYSYSFDGENWQWTPFLTPGKANQFEVKKDYPHSIRINEILPNPSGEEELNEYIELYNFGSQTIDLSRWILKDSSKSGKFIFPEKSLIKSKNFQTIYRSDFKFALNNSGEETVYLLDPDETVVFSIFFTEAKEDVSYNFSGEEWRWSKFLTPGAENKFNNLPKIEIKIDSKIYEDIYADFKVKVNDPDRDKIKVVWNFGDGHKSYKKETRHKYEKTGKYSASLKIFDGSEEITEKFEIEVKKFSHPKVRISRIMPNPKGKDSELEWIEIKNKSSKEINLKNWSIATGSSSKKIANHPIREDFFIQSGKIKKITKEFSKFSLNNKKGRVELRYPDGKVAYKIKYKKESGVKDDEVYEKNKGEKWKWTENITNAPDIQIIENIEDKENVEIIPDNNKDGLDIGIIENEKFIGGQSDNLSENKKIALLMGGLDNKTLEGLILNLANSEVKEIKEINEAYVFNSPVSESKHYAMKFLEKLTREMNGQINRALNNQPNLLN